MKYAFEADAAKTGEDALLLSLTVTPFRQSKGGIQDGAQLSKLGITKKML